MKLPLEYFDEMVKYAHLNRCSCIPCRIARDYTLEILKAKCKALEKQLSPDTRTQELLDPVFETEVTPTEEWLDAKKKCLP